MILVFVCPRPQIHSTSITESLRGSTSNNGGLFTLTIQKNMFHFSLFYSWILPIALWRSAGRSPANQNAGFFLSIGVSNVSWQVQTTRHWTPSEGTKYFAKFLVAFAIIFSDRIFFFISHQESGSVFNRLRNETLRLFVASTTVCLILILSNPSTVCLIYIKPFSSTGCLNNHFAL